MVWNAQPPPSSVFFQQQARGGLGQTPKENVDEYANRSLLVFILFSCFSVSALRPGDQALLLGSLPSGGGLHPIGEDRFVF